MMVATRNKQQVFYSDNLDVINFWINQIDIARKFYNWLQNLIKLRYNSPAGTTPSGEKDEKSSIQTVDKIINKILKIQVPEVDMDQYDPKKMKVSAYDYAVKKATEFMEQYNN